jgi:hypothetical protein
MHLLPLKGHTNGLHRSHNSPVGHPFAMGLQLQSRLRFKPRPWLRRMSVCDTIRNLPSDPARPKTLCLSRRLAIDSLLSAKGPSCLVESTISPSARAPPLHTHAFHARECILMFCSRSIILFSSPPPPPKKTHETLHLPYYLFVRLLLVQTSQPSIAGTGGPSDEHWCHAVGCQATLRLPERLCPALWLSPALLPAHLWPPGWGFCLHACPFVCLSARPFVHLPVCMSVQGQRPCRFTLHNEI